MDRQIGFHLDVVSEALDVSYDAIDYCYNLLTYFDKMHQNAEYLASLNT